MKNKRKRALTLIEVIISMVLIGILLTALFNCYRHIVKNQIAAKQLKSRTQEFQLFNLRVQRYFENLSTSETHPFCLQRHPTARAEALSFYSEQKYDKDIDFSGALHTMLYLDEKERLSCATWGANKKARVDTLLEHIRSLRYEFFDKEKSKWVKEWPKNKQGIPAMVKLLLKPEKEEIAFVYFLEHPTQAVSIAPPSMEVKPL